MISLKVCMENCLFITLWTLYIITNFLKTPSPTQSFDRPPPDSWIMNLTYLRDCMIQNETTLKHCLQSSIQNDTREFTVALYLQETHSIILNQNFLQFFKLLQLISRFLLNIELWFNHFNEYNEGTYLKEHINLTLKFKCANKLTWDVRKRKQNLEQNSGTFHL